MSTHCWMDGWLSILVVSVSSWLPRRVSNQLDSTKSHGNGRLATCRWNLKDIPLKYSKKEIATNNSSQLSDLFTKKKTKRQGSLTFRALIGWLVQSGQMLYSVVVGYMCTEGRNLQNDRKLKPYSPGTSKFSSKLPCIVSIVKECSHVTKFRRSPKLLLYFREKNFYVNGFTTYSAW